MYSHQTTAESGKPPAEQTILLEKRACRDAVSYFRAQKGCHKVAKKEVF